MRLAYVYELTDKETGKWYIGSRTAKGCFPEEIGVSYFTSSKEVSKLFESDPSRFEIKILVTSEDHMYIINVESDILSSRDAKMDPLSYNMHNGDGKMNMVKSGAISGKTVGTRMYQEKSGMFHPSLRGKGGKVAGKANVALRRGFFSRSKEQHSIDSSNAGKLTRDLKLGIHGKSFEWLSEHNTKNGNASYADKKGVHSRSKEQMTHDANKANSFRWKCDECGMESIAMGIGRHQKYSGHSGKTKIT